MKEILLIGDSIREGYDFYVKKAFEGVAEVYYPSENCRYAEYVLRELHRWKEELNCSDNVDCVHINVGLWDTLRLFGDEPLTPIDAYKNFIERIFHRINVLFPKAKIIFANSTPVIEKQFPEPWKMMRYNSDMFKYNKTAEKIALEYCDGINDLWNLMKNVPDSFHSDQTHFYTLEGTKLITEAVINSIEQCLNIKSNIIDYEKEFKKKNSFVGQ